MTMLRVWMTVALLFCASAWADLQVEDPALQRCLSLLSEKNGWTSPEEVTELVCHNKGVKTALGTEKFVNLTKLSLYRNEIGSIDVSSMTSLTSLNVAGNALQGLEVNGLPRLEKLFVFHNELAELTVRGCPELQSIKGNNNQLRSVVFDGLKALEKVYLFNNELELMDITGLPALRLLDVRHNPMPDDFYDYLDTIAHLTSLHDGNAEDWD